MECEGGGLSTAQGQGGYLGIVSSGAEQDLSKPMGMELSCLCKQVKGELPSSHFPNIPHFSYLHYSTVCFSSRAASVQTEAVPKFCVRRDKAAAKCGTRVCLLGSPWATALPGLGDVQTHPECPGAAQARSEKPPCEHSFPYLSPSSYRCQQRAHGLQGEEGKKDALFRP